MKGIMAAIVEWRVALKVEILTASCCTRYDVKNKIECVLRSLKSEIPELDWKVLDIAAEPELAVKYQIPLTPAIFIDGNLEFIGYPRRPALEAKIRNHLRK